MAGNVSQVDHHPICTISPSALLSGYCQLAGHSNPFLFLGHQGHHRFSLFLVRYHHLRPALPAPAVARIRWLIIGTVVINFAFQP